MTEPARVGPIGPGDQVGGFVIEAIAGRGGMGVVYRARQVKPNRLVALKVITPDLADDPVFRARFERESTIAAQIEHPNVIPVHAVGEDGGVLFIAMRFVAGIDLRSLIIQNGRLEPRRAAGIVDQVGQALDAAHGHGLVHRDVKPANILLSAAGGRDHAYLTDFGLSRHIEGSQGVTGTGAFLGTIDYVAPEQARAEAVDARTDVYSLGCVLFHALTGTVPFPLGNDLAKLYAHGTQNPPSVCERDAEVPRTFDPVLRRAMAKTPDERYLSAGDLGRAALAAAANASTSRAETSVAVDAAAPRHADAVRTRPTTGPQAGAAGAAGAAATPDRGLESGETEPDAAEPAAPAAAGRPQTGARRRGPILAGAAALVGCALIAAIVLLAAGGGGGRRPSARAAPVAVGLVRGVSIGPVSLGQTPAAVARELQGAGYRLIGRTGAESVFVSPVHGKFVVDYFDNGRTSLIHKYNDASVAVGGVSINSTVRQARAALAGWLELRCPSAQLTLFAAPGGRTFFELPLAPDQGNVNQGNGIDVSSSPVDRSNCGGAPGR